MITCETIIKWAKECKFSGRVKGTVFLADLSELNEFAKKAMYHAYELAADRCDELSDNAKHPDDINGYGCAAEIRALQWKVVYKDKIPEFKEVAAWIYEQDNGDGTRSTVAHIGKEFPTYKKTLSAPEPVYRKLDFNLEDCEQYNLQMSAIATAAIGYWKEGDPIKPEYDTVLLRDVAKLYAKYETCLEDNKLLRNILQELMDCQNGIPLEKYKESWEKAMQKAKTLLKDSKLEVAVEEILKDPNLIK